MSADCAVLSSVTPRRTRFGITRLTAHGTLTHGLFDRWAGRFKPVLAEMLIRKGGRLRGIDAATPTPEDCTPRRPIRHSARRCPLSPPPPLCSPPAPASPAPPCAPPRPRVSPPRAASRSSAPRRRVRSFSALLLLSRPPAHALVTGGGSDRRLWRGFDRRATRVRRGVAARSARVFGDSRVGSVAPEPARLDRRRVCKRHVFPTNI